MSHMMLTVKVYIIVQLASYVAINTISVATGIYSTEWLAVGRMETKLNCSTDFLEFCGCNVRICNKSGSSEL